MKAKTVTITIGIADSVPIVREAAFQAARCGALLDHVTRKTHESPASAGAYDSYREQWREKFLRHKRICEAFGVEHETTSEQETLTVTFAYLPGRVAKQDFSKPYPTYWRDVHIQACHAAAERVVRKFLELHQ